MRPHTPGHAPTRRKSANTFGKPILPTPLETAILRRIARGYAVLTFNDGRRLYSYDDGAPITRDGRALTDREWGRLVNNRWIIGDKRDTMFDAAPQIYRARKP